MFFYSFVGSLEKRVPTHHFSCLNAIITYFLQFLVVESLLELSGAFYILNCFLESKIVSSYSVDFTIHPGIIKIFELK